MAEYSSWGALKKALQKEMLDATEEARDESYKQLQLNLQRFYTGGYPSSYVRTGKFGDSADFSGLTGGGDSVFTTVYMDGDYQYSTGSYPSGWTVFQWAEFHDAGIVGLPYTWANTEEDVDEIVDKVFSKHFS